MTMSSSTDSSPSPSSDATSYSLDVLVSHLLASKRSLACINHVYRANELAISARKSLETSSITSARTFFLRSGIDAQVKVLSQVRNNSNSVAKEGAAELTVVTQTLADAKRRLRETLDLLKNTVVEASLRPWEEGRKTLLDFVDESGVAALTTAINESLRAAGSANKDFGETNAAFDNDLRNVQDILRQTREQRGADGGAEVTGSPLPEILQSMEDHAKDMANNLESLVKHFDFCVTAIKHTEGGGDAAQHIAGDLPEGVDLGQATVSAPAEPIGEEERKEMLKVLENDAGQVDDVIMEIKDHMSQMEAQYETVIIHTKSLVEEYENTRSAFQLLKQIGVRLPGYIAQSPIFAMRWDDERAKIEDYNKELEGLRLFYAGFLRAYDNLLVEIGRRKTLELKAEKITRDAMAKIQKLYEDDAEERRAFKQEQGEYLPHDIWPGLTAGPLQYKIATVGLDAERVPEVSNSTIQQAIHRISHQRKFNETISAVDGL